MSGTIITDVIELRSGAAPSTPGTGKHRFYVKTDGLPYFKGPDGVELAISVVQKVSYVNDDVSAVIANTTAETAFDKSLALLEAALAVGTRIRVRASGTVLGVGLGGHNLVMRVRLGGVSNYVLAAIPELTPAGGDDWSLDYSGHVLATGADNARDIRGDLHGNAGPGMSSRDGMRATAVGVDTTQALAVQVTAQWSAADPANQVQLSSIEIDVE